MATAVRKTRRVILFIALFLFSLRFIHPYPIQFTIKQSGQLTQIANRLGFRDPEMFYLLAVMLINTLITCTLYFIAVRGWRLWRQRKAKPEHRNP